MDGVWLPADGEQPGARSFPGSRHTLKAKGQGGRPFAPLPPRQRPVGKSTKLTRAETNHVMVELQVNRDISRWIYKASSAAPGRD